MNNMPSVIHEVCSCDDGAEAVLQYPRDMTVSDVADLQKWLSLVIRKIKRQQTNRGAAKESP
jgi:hypothetical protein